MVRMPDTKNLVTDLSNTLVIVLAGGKGTRLGELTRRMPKPAIPFGGKLRIIDFSLFNAINSGADEILVLTQYGHWDLQRHIEALNLTSMAHGKRVSVVPPHYYEGQGVYTHTANAVFQNIEAVLRSGAKHVLILSGDHVYKMDYRQMLRQHLASGSDFTVCTMNVTRADAHRFGILETDGEGFVTHFREKPKDLSQERPYAASLGIYLADTTTLIDVLRRDAADKRSSHDFGTNIIPALIRGDHGNNMRVGTYDFASHVIPGENGPYWRDVGVLKDYISANLDQTALNPELNLYNQGWPFMTVQDGEPNMKFVPLPDVPSWPQRCLQFTAAGGTTIDWPVNLERVVMGRRVHIGEQSMLEDSVIHSGARIGRHVHMHRTIVMEDAVIPDGTMIGYDPDMDRERGCHVYPEDGVVIVPSPELA